MSKSFFDACCNTEHAINSVQTQAPMQQPGVAQAGTTRTANEVQTQATVQQRVTQAGTNLLTKVEEKVPMVAPITGQMRNMMQPGPAILPQDDRLYPNVISGRGEVKQSFGESIAKYNMPTIAIFPANSKTGLATLRALTGYPNRNTCAKIQCIVRNESDIADVRGELNEHLTDSISFAFADFEDEGSMTSAFIGLDRLLLIPPNKQNRSQLVCRGLYSAGIAGVPHVVLMSAMSALQPNTLFGRDFRKMEEYLEGMRPKVNFTHMRMAWFMDNFLDMAGDIVSNNRFMSSWGPSAVSAVALADIGRSAAAVLVSPSDSVTHYGRVYHLTGPESLSGFRMAEVFSRLLDRPVAYHDLPKDEMRAKYLEMHVPEWQADGYVEMNEQIKSGAAAAYSTDVAMLAKGNHTTFERYLRNKRWYFLGQRSPLICIIPASGRVGSNILNALIADKSRGRIRAVIRSETQRAEMATKYADVTRLEFVHGDFEEAESIKSALTGVDNLMIIPPEKLERFSLIDECMKAAYAAGVSHTVLLSVSKAFDATVLGRKFNAWERVLEANSHSYTIIQSSLFHDLMFHFAEQVMRPDHRVHHWLGNGRFCPVDARDVGQACAAVLREGPFEHHGRTYSLYGPQALNLSEMCEILSRVLGYRVEAVPDITMDQVRATMKDKLPSFSIEEVVQAHETVANGSDIEMTPDLIKLTGHARTIQAFFEDNRERFESNPYQLQQQQQEQQQQVQVPQAMVATEAKAAPVMEKTTVTTTTITQETTEPVEAPAPQVVQT